MTMFQEQWTSSKDAPSHMLYFITYDYDFYFVESLFITEHTLGQKFSCINKGMKCIVRFYYPITMCH